MNFTDFTPEQQDLLLACESPEEARALLLSGELMLSDEILDEIAGGNFDMDAFMKLLADRR